MPEQPADLLGLWDALRVFCVVGGVATAVGLISQLLHPMPGLRPEVQQARAAHVTATLALLLAEGVVNYQRLGRPPIPSRLLACTVGITALLLWMWLERRARKAAAE